MLDAIGERQDVFLSTPSARRATCTCPEAVAAYEFLSTPSARRATTEALIDRMTPRISIHALREEGDEHGGKDAGDRR